MLIQYLPYQLRYFSNEVQKNGRKIGSTCNIVMRMKPYLTGHPDKVPLECYYKILNPELYTGSMGMFDVAKNSTLGYNPAFLGGQGPATFAGGGGYDTSLLGGLKRGVSGIMPGDVLMGNPVGYGNLALNAYGTMNQPQAPLQPSPMLSAQQLMGQQGPVPTPQFNSLLQPSRRPILIG